MKNKSILYIIIMLLVVTSVNATVSWYKLDGNYNDYYGNTIINLTTSHLSDFIFVASTSGQALEKSGAPTTNIIIEGDISQLLLKKSTLCYDISYSAISQQNDFYYYDINLNSGFTCSVFNENGINHQTEFQLDADTSTSGYNIDTGIDVASTGLHKYCWIFDDTPRNYIDGIQYPVVFSYGNNVSDDFNGLNATIDFGLQNVGETLDNLCYYDYILNNTEILYINTTNTCPDNFNPCTENWVTQYNPAACDYRLNQTKYYVDSNSCGTTIGLPVDNNTIVSCVTGNVVGWDLLMNGQIGTAAYTSFNTPLAGYLLLLIFCVITAILFLNASVELSFIIGLIFLGAFGIGGWLNTISLNVIITILAFELAGVFYKLIVKT